MIKVLVDSKGGLRRSSFPFCLALAVGISSGLQASPRPGIDSADSLASALYDLPTGDQIPGFAENKREYDLDVGNKLKQLNPGREQEIDQFFDAVTAGLRNGCITGVRKEIALRINNNFSADEIRNLTAFAMSDFGSAYFAFLRRSAYSSDNNNITIPDSADARRLLAKPLRVHFISFYADLITNRNHWIRLACEAGEGDPSTQQMMKLRSMGWRIPEETSANASLDKRNASGIDDKRYKNAVDLITRDKHSQAAAILQELSDEGDISAKALLGELYFKGKGVPLDFERALKLSSDAAQAHDVQGEHDLAVMYSYGAGTTKDAHAAFELFYKSAEAGYLPSEYSLAERYRLGDGVQKDLDRALTWYRRAADGQFVPALRRMGEFYFQGQLVEKDYSVAVQWFQKGAIHGDAQSEYDLGVAYSLGHGVPQNSALAFGWYMKAAVQGLPDAQFALGFCYAEGKGVPKDMAAAVQWYLRAASQGHGGAQFNLGFAYGLGQGVPVDPAMAYKWFALSVTRPETEKPEAAKFNRDHAASQMTETQLESAKAVVAAWKPHSEAKP